MVTLSEDRIAWGTWEKLELSRSPIEASGEDSGGQGLCSHSSYPVSTRLCPEPVPKVSSWSLEAVQEAQLQAAGDLQQLQGVW